MSIYTLVGRAFGKPIYQEKNMGAKDALEISGKDLQSLVIQMIKIGKSMGYKPDEFAIILSAISKYMLSIDIVVNKQK